MRFNARIPVIPLPYKDRRLAVEKELVIDYGHDDVYPTIYIVDEKDRTKLWDITQGIRDSVSTMPGDNLTIEIDGVGTFELGDLLNLLYTIGLTHKEDFSIEDLQKMIPTTIIDNQGVLYAPRTLSANVFTESGESIDVRLKSFSRLGNALRYVVATEERQQTFVIPYPFENYTTEGNTFWIYVGGILVDSRRYYVSEDGSTLTFIDSDDYVEKGRTCMFSFWYNSSTPDTGVLLVMDGKYITPYSIETNRLANVSDAINLNDPTAIASSKAVKTLYDVISQRIDSIAGNKSISATSMGTATELIAKVNPEYELADTNNIYLRLHVNLGASATLKINDYPAFPIYSGNTKVASGPQAGDILELSFNALENRFYVYNTTRYRLLKSNYIYYAKAGETRINFDIPSYNALIDNLHVYQNNSRLFEQVNYYLNETSIDLIGYESEEDDVFVFEVDQVVPVKL